MCFIMRVCVCVCVCFVAGFRVSCTRMISEQMCSVHVSGLYIYVQK